MTLTMVGLCFISGGCSATFELEEIAYSTNAEKQFVNEQSFGKSPEVVYTALTSFLEKENARIIARDTDNKLICWTPTSADFEKLLLGERQKPSYGNFMAAKGIYTSACVRDANGKSTVVLHSTLRHNVDSSISYSNGKYERYILDQLAQRLKDR